NPLLDDRRLPWHIEQDQAAAEFEVPPLAASLSRHHQARTVRIAESRHLGIAPCCRQLFVEDATRKLHTMAECGAQHLERLSMRNEDERLLFRLAPAWRIREQPHKPRVGLVHRLRPLAEVAILRTQYGGQRRARCERSTDAVDPLSFGGPPE